MTAPDLKPCPFCGVRLIVSLDHPDVAEHAHGDVDCVLAGSGITDDQFAAWNTRATPAALSPEVRALVDAAEAQLQYMDMCNDKGDLERNLRAAVAAVRGIGGGNG